MKNISWWDVYICENAEDAVDIISSRITALLDVMAPVKVFKYVLSMHPGCSKIPKRISRKESSRNPR